MQEYHIKFIGKYKTTESTFFACSDENAKATVEATKGDGYVTLSRIVNGELVFVTNIS